jgi:hypothetical protein
MYKLKLMKNHIQKLFTKRTLKMAILISGLLGLMAFIEFSPQNIAATISKKEKEQKYVSGFSIVDGKYIIDSATILNNRFTVQHFGLELESQKLKDIKTVSEIPGFIRIFLDSISPTGEFDMANPFDAWKIVNITAFSKHVAEINDTLPSRQLVYFLMGKNIALLSYYTSDFIYMHQHIAILKFKDEKITDLWFENIPGTIPDAKKEIIGRLKSNKDLNSGGC